MSLLESLPLPVIAAPMAGGPSTPQLVAAVAQAGGFGFLAGGTAQASELADDMRRAHAEVSAGKPGKSSHARGFGVNLFCRQNPYHRLDEVRRVARMLQPEFAARGLDGPRVPDVEYDFGWSDKLSAVLAAAAAGSGPAVVSCTFGCFTSEEVESLHEAGVEAWVTVTNERDALAAERVGADALVVQGPEAGGHRSTWTVETIPDLRPLPALLRAVHNNVSLPLVAAGGVSSASRVAAALELAGVRAVACGTAFLCADEAGTSTANRRLLAAGGPTESTRAFSGRYARGLATEFTRKHRELPPCYPHLNQMLAPLRGEPEFAYCLAGEGVADVHPAPAAALAAELAEEARGGRSQEAARSVEKSRRGEATADGA